jgi:hypothetical protein
VGFRAKQINMLTKSLGQLLETLVNLEQEHEGCREHHLVEDECLSSKWI